MKPRSNPLHPHSAFIDNLGAALIRQQFKLSYQRLSNWRTRGIPDSARPAIAQLATLHGKPVPSDFLPQPRASKQQEAA